MFQSSQNEEEHYEVVYEGLAEQFKIKGLTPSTRYRIRLIATNSDGDSQPSAPITVYTSALFHPPKQPHCPQLVSLSSKSIKLSWNTQPQHSYTVNIPMCFTSLCWKQWIRMRKVATNGSHEKYVDGDRKWSGAEEAWRDSLHDHVDRQTVPWENAWRTSSWP